MTKTIDETKRTLQLEDIVTSPRMSRRSALGMIGVSVVGAAAIATGLAPVTARAQTDSDSGPSADQAGRGRTGSTDSDSGPNADRGGHGRGSGLSVGQNVEVLWNGTWYAASILALLADGTVRIHYTGWASSWDENVSRDRIR